MKKILALLLAVVMVLGLVACDNAGGETTPPATNGDEVPTLKWMMVGGGMPANYDAWQANLNAYLEEKIGVHVDVEVVGWGDWDTTRNMTVSTNGAYDIMFTNNGTFTNDVAIGAFMDISTLIDSAPALKEFIPASYWDACKVDGKLYAVPTYKDSSSTQYWVLDKQLADMTGIDYNAITDMAGMTELLAAMQPLETDLHPAGSPTFILNQGGLDAIYSRNYDDLSSGIPAIGVSYHNGRPKVVSVFEQADVLADLEVLRSWYEAGYINSDAAILAEAPSYRSAFVAQGWSLAAKTTWGPNMGKHPNGDPIEAIAVQWGPTVLSNATVQGSMNCISAACKYPEKALQLLELVNTDSYVRDALYFGLEGDNFDYVEVDGEKRVHKNNGDWTMAGYTQGTFFAVTQLDEEEFNQWDEVKELNAAAVGSPVLGFSFNTAPVEAEISACTAIFTEYRASLMTGTADTTATMVEAMYAAGLQEIIDEAQDQIDAWIAAK